MAKKLANMNRRNPATFVRAIDGDTVELVIDVGHKIAVTEIVRLAGINCAERDTEAGQAAKRAVEEWFANEGSAIVVETIKGDTWDKYGRYLANVTSRHGADLVADLIAGGHAVRWTGRGTRPAA